MATGATDRNTLIHFDDEGAALSVESGGTIALATGAALTVNGVDLIASIAALSGLDATELGYLNGVTAGTATASKALVVDSNKDIATVRNVTMNGALTFSAGGKIDTDSGTGTCSSNAVTISKMAGVITTESLTTAAGASQAITLTNTLVASGDIILVQLVGGTNTRKTIAVEALAGSGSATITLNNIGPSDAFNGTIILGFLLLKA